MDVIRIGHKGVELATSPRSEALAGSGLTFLLAGLDMGLEHNGALEFSVSADLASRDLLLKRSLLQTINGLRTGGLNSTIKKQGSKDMSTSKERHKENRRHVKQITIRRIPLAYFIPELNSISFDGLGLPLDSEEILRIDKDGLGTGVDNLLLVLAAAPLFAVVSEVPPSILEDGFFILAEKSSTSTR